MQQEEIIGLASDTVETGVLMYQLLMEFISEPKKPNTLPDLVKKMEDSVPIYSAEKLPLSIICGETALRILRAK